MPRCDCTFDIDNEHFSCQASQGRLEDTVVFRASIKNVQGLISAIYVDDVSTDIKNWVNTQPNLTVSQLVLTVDPNCPTSFDSFESEDCTITDQSTSNDASSIAIVSGSVLATALILITIIIVVAMWCYKQKPIQRYSVYHVIQNKFYCTMFYLTVI